MSNDQNTALRVLRPDSPSSLISEERYVHRADGMYRQLRSEVRATPKNGSRPTNPTLEKLCNFSARIVKEYIVAGTNERVAFELEAQLESESLQFEVTVAEFEAMSWLLKKLGARATKAAINRIDEHLAVAIQSASTDIGRVLLVPHIGWVAVEGWNGFCHADGIVWAKEGKSTFSEAGHCPSHNLQNATDLPPSEPKGANGPTFSQFAEVRPHVSGALRRYSLPSTLSTASQRREAIEFIWKFITLAPRHLTVPLLAFVVSSPVTQAPFVLFLSGKTGSGKSSLAAVAQQFFGPTMDESNLPGSWTSTANANEALGYEAKDAIAFIDDFVYRENASDADRLSRDADRILRAVGNHVGRSRCDRNGNLSDAKVPRGSLGSTAEDLPTGLSANARLLNLPIEPDDVDLDKLSICQRDAKQGLPARLMATYIAWLGGRLERARALFRRRFEKWRKHFQGETMHGRSGVNAAHLVAGMEVFGAFLLLDMGVRRSALLRDLRYILVASLAELLKWHDATLSQSDPVDQFLRAVESCLVSGQGHFAWYSTGRCPEVTPERWGWTRRKRRKDETPIAGQCNESSASTDESEEYFVPSGTKIGWTDGELLYFQPRTILAAAQKIIRASGEFLVLRSTTLGKKLHEQGKLVVRDEGRRRYTHRMDIESGRIDVLVIRPNAVFHEPTGSCPWKDEESGLSKPDDLLEA